MDTLFIFCAKYLIAVPVIILGLYFLTRPGESKVRMVVFAIPALVLTLLIDVIAGHLYFDPRPFVVEHITPLIPHAADNGFPSDHALLATALASLALFWNKKIALVLWIIAMIIMIARVYVRVHHPIDVMGSALISLAAISTVYLLFTRVWHKPVQ